MTGLGGFPSSGTGITEVGVCTEDDDARCSSNIFSLRTAFTFKPAFSFNTLESSGWLILRFSLGSVGFDDSGILLTILVSISAWADSGSMF